MKTVDVINACYVEDYKVKIYFSDNTSQVVYFWPFLKNNDHPLFNKYRKVETFKQFKVDPKAGNIVWGNDWDLIFPVSQLYRGKIRA
jgi:hypothetical protein